MAFKTNPWLEEWEKKHPKLSLVISLLVPVLGILAGFWLLFSSISDKSVSILMLVLGSLALVCTVLLRIRKK